MAENHATISDHVTNALARGLLLFAGLFPYRRRVPMVGWVISRLVAPLVGWNRRASANLRLVFPQMPDDEIRRIVRGATDNAGRAIIETYSGPEFSAQVQNAPLTGPGVAALMSACRDKRPVLLVSGHIGNYDAIAVALAREGVDMGVLYRPMKNPLFNKHYVAALAHFAKPPVATDRRGITAMIRGLRAGRLVAMNHDVRQNRGVALSFMGQPALTSVTPAEWAMKYDALLVPIYGIRQADGLNFEVHVETPVARSSAVEGMAQELNDALDRQVRLHPEQWFWMHNRWKRP